MRISDWSSDVCSSDLLGAQHVDRGRAVACHQHLVIVVRPAQLALEPQIILDDQQFARSLHAASPSAATRRRAAGSVTRKRVPSPSRLATLTSPPIAAVSRSEEHTSELQSLMRISYAVFCLKKTMRNIRDWKIKRLKRGQT